MLPAQAGMIPDTLVNETRGGGAPRASGDDPYRALHDEIVAKCSPRKRG